jgi:hypothetical protein
MLQEIFLDLLLGAGAGTAKPSINGLLLQILTLRLPGTITEVLSPGCEKCPSKLSAPCLTQSLLHPGQHTTLLFLDVMVDRLICSSICSACPFSPWLWATSSVSPASSLATG